MRHGLAEPHQIVGNAIDADEMQTLQVGGLRQPTRDMRRELLLVSWSECWSESRTEPAECRQSRAEMNPSPPGEEWNGADRTGGPGANS